MSGIYDNSTISRIQQANDIADVISEHVSLKKKGREVAGVCPFHNDHRPSMYVSEVKQIFKCFACGAGGDVFKFVQMREGLTFPEAVERLAQRAGIEIVSTGRVGNDRRSDVSPKRLAKANLWAQQLFAKNLQDQEKGEKARQYLLDRGINSESIEKWHLGLSMVGNDLLKRAQKQKCSLEVLKKGGLVNGHNDDKFMNRLMFPISDVTGRVIGFGGRTLDGTGAKYINSPTTDLFDKSNCLYGIEQSRHEIVSKGRAVVVEGYTDVIMAHQCGCGNVVATLGTSFTSGHGRMLRRYAKEVVLVYDGDQAGVEAANRALEVCLSEHIDIRISLVPKGQDPFDFLVKNGGDGFEKLVTESIDVFEFKWTRLQESFDSDNSFSGRKKAIEEFFETISSGIQSGALSVIDRGLIVNRLCKIIGIGADEVNRELKKRLSRRLRSSVESRETGKTVEVDMGEDLKAFAERELLEILINEPKYYGIVNGKVGVNDFEVPILARIAKVVFDSIGENPDAQLCDFLRQIEDVEVGCILTDISESGAKKGRFDQRLKDSMEVIERKRRENMSEQLKGKIEDAEFFRNVIDGATKDNRRSLGIR